VWIFVKLVDQKRFACNICPARFKDSSSCRRHMRKHATGKTHICSVCLMPFKRAAQLKSHQQQQQHSLHVTADSVLTTPGNIESTDETLASPDLTLDISVNALYHNSSPVEVLDVGQQVESCNVIADQADCSTGPETSTAANTNVDTGNHSAMFSAVSGVSDVTDNSVTAATQSLDYIHMSGSQSEADALFLRERTDSLSLPIPSLAEDSISDIIATADTGSFSMVHNSNLPLIGRPDIDDATYLSWHEQFTNAISTGCKLLSVCGLHWSLI